VAFDASLGHPVIVVVLGSTQEGRFGDVVNLVNASMKYEQGE
jgi:D-alanyl-D-alanine carboxypeptidase